jgi:Uma2 family endonuclease
MTAPGSGLPASYLWELPDEVGRRYEVINGDLYVTPTPWWAHQYQLGQLLLDTTCWVDKHDLGTVVGSLTAVVLDTWTCVLPDGLFISHQRKHLISKRGVEGPPDLIVEVINEITEERDRGLKLDVYAAAGVPHYWILDTDGPRIEERVLGEDGYRLVGTFGPGEIFRPTIFPGLEIPLDDIAG